MSDEFDAVVRGGPEEKLRPSAEVQGMTREQAIEHGAQLGAHAADERGETGRTKEQRAARARLYASWDFDGRPTAGGKVRGDT